MVQVLCIHGIPVRANFFFGRTFDLDFSQTTGSKVKSGAFNPLLTTLKTREPARTLTLTMKKTQNGYMLLFHAVLDCVK